MKKIIRRLPIIAGAMLALSFAASAQLVPGAVALPDSIVGTRTLSNDSTYQIINTVKVGPGALLSIPAGTIIYGNKLGTRSALVVERGGKIYAKGRPDRPIIFTSAMPQGAKAPGDWGGIAILGNATINAAGGTSTIPGGTGGIFGGSDDCDSSGVLSYVRIEYTGLPASGDNTLSGLMLAGVGARTAIDHVQVSYAGDDSYAWFGGTVRGRNLIAFAGTDDDFDTDLGYRRRLQFLFGMRDSSRSESLISNGLESDNDATGSSNTPMTLPVISNLTLAGPFSDVSQPHGLFGSGGVLRRNTRYGLFNSVITGYQSGLRLEGSGIGSIPPSCPQPSTLRLANTVVSSDTVIWGASGTSTVDVAFWFVCFAGNANPGNHPNVGLQAVSQADLYTNDPRPTSTSPADTGTAFSDSLLMAAAPGSCSIWSFDSTSYKGAFDPAQPRNQQWDSSWSNYKPHLTTYLKGHRGWNMIGLANTPSSPHKDSIFHFASSHSFRFNGSYAIDDTLDAGTGYWIELDSNNVIEQVGATISLPVTIPVSAGWNMISTGASEPALVANITASSTTILSGFFGYFGPSNGYTTVTTLQPGLAYWVNVSTTGTLTLNH